MSDFVPIVKTQLLLCDLYGDYGISIDLLNEGCLCAGLWKDGKRIWTSTPRPDFIEMNCVTLGEELKQSGLLPPEFELKDKMLMPILRLAKQQDLLLDPSRAVGYYTPARPNDYFDENHRFMPSRLGDELMVLYNFKTMRDNREIFVYEKSVYLPIGEGKIKSEVRKRLHEKTTKYHTSEVVEHIRDLSLADRSIFNQDPNLICLENGVYDLATGEMENHSPDKFFAIKHPVTYNPNADCPTIDRFLKEILPKPEDQEAVMQLVGYCVYRKYPIQKAFMMVGSGANGKSTLLNMIKMFLGKENVTSTSLQELENNRFAVARLLGKCANIYPDLPASALYSTGKFKGSTGGDLLTGEFKFGKDFNFENHAKFIFSANQIPQTRDESYAFFRRWTIITFPNKFEGSKDDKNLINKLTTPEELSGLLNKAIAGLKKLLAEGKFANDKIVDDIRDEYIRRSDPIQAFVWDMVEYDFEAQTTKDLVYSTYLGYCKSKSYVPVDSARFHKYLPAKQPGISTYRPRLEDGSRPVCWRGVKLKDAQEVFN